MESREQPILRQEAALVDEALALAASGRPLTDSREEARGAESVRGEHELRRREDGLFVFVRRESRLHEGRLCEADERRAVAGEGRMRSMLAGQREWLERAVAAARLARPQDPTGPASS
jgi:hypothetical protein